ncbi:hypothetical protein QE357_003531 [Siphonobacter sp. BAB-5404]|nr:hypothetical protein [Siphonobacter sp. SORGH_AS_0500]
MFSFPVAENEKQSPENAYLSLFLVHTETAKVAVSVLLQI